LHLVLERQFELLQAGNQNFVRPGAFAFQPDFVLLTMQSPLKRAGKNKFWKRAGDLQYWYQQVIRRIMAQGLPQEL